MNLRTANDATHRPETAAPLVSPQSLSYSLDMNFDTIAYSVGYAGRDVDGFVRLLKRSGIDRVVDVRALPLSRRRGFSKTKLCEVLATNGIEYVHLRRAGNPYRDQKNDIKRCLALYAGYLDESPEIVTEVEGALLGHRAALLCVEADHSHCHRSILAARLQSNHPARRFTHL
jgi:uncharacterized protein (DUF488 family)